MKLAFKKMILVFAVLSAMFFAVDQAAAQREERPTRLRSGVAVKGFIGGESHNSYVIRARRGQTMTVVITRRVKSGGNFNLTVSRGGFDAEPVKFGQETSGRTQLRWTGRIPASGNYYFYTTAFPDARYTLKVTLR
jgi:hypothetical protein